MAFETFTDYVQYLREKAGRLREAAQGCPPEVAAKLRGLADEFEAYAARLEAQGSGTAH